MEPRDEGADLLQETSGMGLHQGFHRQPLQRRRPQFAPSRDLLEKVGERHNSTGATEA